MIACQNSTLAVSGKSLHVVCRLRILGFFGAGSPMHGQRSSPAAAASFSSQLGRRGAVLITDSWLCSRLWRNGEMGKWGIQRCPKGCDGMGIFLSTKAWQKLKYTLQDPWILKGFKTSLSLRWAKCHQAFASWRTWHRFRRGWVSFSIASDIQKPRIVDPRPHQWSKCSW